jgi:hypothetical protein
MGSKQNPIVLWPAPSHFDLRPFYDCTKVVEQYYGPWKKESDHPLQFICDGDSGSVFI